MNVCRWSAPIGVIGLVVECGLVKIFRNVLKFVSGISSGDFDELSVDGTLRISFENCASAWSFVVRYLTSSHAWSRFFPVFGMPMIVPLMYPEPYRFGCASSTGIGAVPYCSSGCSCLMNETRHSPSSIIASLPVSKACDAENSSPAPVCHLTSLS